MSSVPTRRILGVDFFVGPLDQAVDMALAHYPVVVACQPAADSPSLVECPGGVGVEPVFSDLQQSATLIVAPNAPGLAVDLVHSHVYQQALRTADLVLTDSGFMVLTWRLLTGERLPRHSGLKFLDALLLRPELKQPGSVFWVMPSAKDDARNRAWLTSKGFPVTDKDVYIAPRYAATGELLDADLIKLIDVRRPQIVILCVGGGVQERLGMALRSRLSCRSTIICLGAAISFRSKGQVYIPPWADRLVLGWLLRILNNPRTFSRRYFTAINLAPLLWHHRKGSKTDRVHSGIKQPE